jgi:hypothetical protein
MKRQTYLYVSGCIFGIVSVLHFVRVALKLPVQLGTLSFPVGFSWPGGVAALILCVWGLRLAKRN